MRVWNDACQKISFLYLGWFNSWLYKYVRNNVNNLSKLLTGFCTNKLQIWQQATMNGPHRHALFYTLMQYCCKLNATNILQWVHSCGLGVYGQSMESWIRYIFGGMIIPNKPKQILVTFRLTIMCGAELHTVVDYSIQDAVWISVCDPGHWLSEQLSRYSDWRELKRWEWRINQA